MSENDNFSKAEIQRYRMIFNMIDQDGDEKISANDIEAITKDIDLKFDDSTIKKMLENGKDGLLNFSGFLKIVGSKFSGFSDENELKDSFATFVGKDGIDGSILKNNLIEISEGDADKKAVSDVVDEFTKENKITGYKKFDADKFINSVKQ
ncbi:Myosin type II regulatory light chain [Pichia californica]|nr:Myosin type II regulatory light chain [[Candida] californica]